MFPPIQAYCRSVPPAPSSNEYGFKSISVSGGQTCFSTGTGAVGYGEKHSMENLPFHRVAGFPKRVETIVTSNRL